MRLSLRPRRKSLWLAKLARSSHAVTKDSSSGFLLAAITKPINPSITIGRIVYHHFTAGAVLLHVNRWLSPTNNERLSPIRYRNKPTLEFRNFASTCSYNGQTEQRANTYEFGADLTRVLNGHMINFGYSCSIEN